MSVNLNIISPFPQGRAPMISLRWSIDGGHTWSNSYDRECGQGGEFTKRVRWQRLGSGRDFVFEISMSDAIGYRIIDGYINTEQG